MSTSDEAKGYQFTHLETQLTDAEARRYDVYLDSRGKATIGIGHLVRPEDHLKLGDVIADEQIDDFFEKDGTAFLNEARKEATAIGIYDSYFIISLANADYQLGGFPKRFTETWPMIAKGQYDEAAAKLDESKWMKQTPKRAKAFQQAILKLKNL